MNGGSTKRGRCLAVVGAVFGAAVLVGCGGQAADSKRTPEAHGNARGAEEGAGGSGSEPAPAGTAPVPTVSPPAGAVSPYCPSANFRSADQVVAAGIVGHDLVLVTASGARRVAASFHPTGADDLVMGNVTTKDGRVTASLGEETIRLRADFSVLYTLPGYSSIVSDAGVGRPDRHPYSEMPFVRADGTVVKYADANGPLSVFVYESPDEDGWMLAQWSAPDSIPPTTGLANVDGRLRPFFDRNPDTGYGMTKLAGQYVFLHGTGAHTLTFATSAGAIDVPMDVPDWPGKPTNYLMIAGSGTVGLLYSAYDARMFRVDANAHTVAPVVVPEDASTEVAAGVGGRVIVSPDGGAFLGVDSHGAPLWRYDVARDLVTTVSLVELAPLRTMDGEYCNPPTLVLPYADLGIGLRDDATAGFYVVGTDSSYRRIGRPMRDVMRTTARQVGGAWIVTADDGKNTYCPGFRSFGEDPSGTAVTGNSVQIVPPTGEPLAFQTKDGWAGGITDVESSGFCAFRQPDGQGPESTVYDLGTHTATPFGSFRGFAWIP